MPIRSRSQKIGDAGQNFVRALVDAHPNWMCRFQDLDYGVDLEAELAEASGENQIPTGKLLKLQVKSSASLEPSTGRIAISLDTDFIQYAQQFRLPVLLIAVDLQNQRGWWLWLQKWLLENEVDLANKPHTATRTVHIPAEQTLDQGLTHGWMAVAEGSAPTSTVLALRELVAAAYQSPNSVRLLQGALDLLDVIDAPNRPWAAEKTIDMLIGLGPNVGFWQSSQLVPHLIAVVDRLGSSFSLDQVVQMVAHHGQFSRAGLFGLSQLYDKWPEHAKGLRLPAFFASKDYLELEWYCEAREYYAELDGMSLLLGFANGKLPRAHFGRLQLAESAQERLWSKWPNRGPSALLDHLALPEAG